VLSMTDAAIAALERGELVGLPTDTVYGVAADPSRREAVEALFAAKGRPGVKPIPILCADVAQARTIGVLGDEVAAIAERHWPGGLTLVVRRVAGSPDWVGDPDADTVGLRVPDHPVALEVLRRFGPLAVTSANRSGEDPASEDDGARVALGGAVAVYLEGRGSGGPPSTVVDATDHPPRVLRPGAVEWGPS
jgi:tRNA threonylcarbamoyl adenosine modification protein (Sua5/YciO/YrdC/YwlC family)